MIGDEKSEVKDATRDPQADPAAVKAEEVETAPEEPLDEDTRIRLNRERRAAIRASHLNKESSATNVATPGSVMPSPMMDDSSTERGETRSGK